jgi:predicted transcriptional regulator
MTTVTIRQKLHQFIDKIGEKKVKAIYTIFEEEINQGERISIEQYNKEIDEAMTEVKKGEVYTHEEVVKMSKGW